MHLRGAGVNVMAITFPQICHEERTTSFLRPGRRDPTYFCKQRNKRFKSQQRHDNLQTDSKWTHKKQLLVCRPTHNRCEWPCNQWTVFAIHLSPTMTFSEVVLMFHKIMHSGNDLFFFSKKMISNALHLEPHKRMLSGL